MQPRRGGPASTLGIALVVALTGCGGSHGSALSPAAVAVRYMSSVWNGRFAESSRYTVPAQRDEAAAAAAILSPGSVSGTHLRAGAVHVGGNEATVTILGRLCTSASRLTVAQAARRHTLQCRTNSSGLPSSQAFVVRLVKEHGAWYVTYGP